MGARRAASGCSRSRSRAISSLRWPENSQVRVIARISLERVGRCLSAPGRSAARGSARPTAAWPRCRRRSRADPVPSSARDAARRCPGRVAGSNRRGNHSHSWQSRKNVAWPSAGSWTLVLGRPAVRRRGRAAVAALDVVADGHPVDGCDPGRAGLPGPLPGLGDLRDARRPATGPPWRAMAADRYARTFGCQRARWRATARPTRPTRAGAPRSQQARDCTPVRTGGSQWPSAATARWSA